MRMVCAVLFAATSLCINYSSIGHAASWENDSTRWMRSFSKSPRDDRVPLPSSHLEREGIGEKIHVRGLFDRWKLNESVHAERGDDFVDVTRECKGKIELDFALTPEEWRDLGRRTHYYKAVDGLIDKVGRQLLLDRGEELSGQEKEDFLQALKALAWQESLWQHYIRYKDWFFVVLSGGSRNPLEDWGISQVARSDTKGNLRNETFFKSKGYCSIGSTLYYGFTFE